MDAPTMVRTRWAAIGAAVAVALGAGGVGLIHATEPGGAAAFVPITPCRLFDTRHDAPVGNRIAPLAAGETFTQQVRGTNGHCTIPDSAGAVAMNVTVVNGTAESFLAVWPADVAKPLASSLNWAAGAPPTPNKVDVKLSATGAVSFYNNSGNVDVLADVVGYYVDHKHDDRYYTKQQVDQMLAGYLTEADAATGYVEHSDLTNRGVVRWGYIRDLGSLVEVYQDNEKTEFAGLSVVRTATGVYEVTVPGVAALGAYHAVLVSAQQGQTTVFRACKVFQTVSAGDPAGTLVVRVRCYDQTAALQNTDFSILVLH